MTDSEHRLGVSGVNLVMRHLKLNPVEKPSMDAAIAEIDQLYGLDSVFFDAKRRKLQLAYDATRLCLDCVEEILDKYDIEVSGDWWTRFKEEHYRFVDQNVKDNARQEPWSCHRTPPDSQHRR
ncbi:cation transporter [Billgrantia montanilacus]|uniref:Cation transporter n=1 Tax=Billgrantia montanilacus TaxID=2282305 RepID=A0A368TY58_9GAMM|nr:cation transporter [Halomonas montanilacus]RCV89664.1 cation transporter [Halomonas montanilacus]